jgi:hypothetical protein
MIYLSYFLGNLAILRARLGGWPKIRAPFRLGRWGLVVNIVGLLYGGAMLVNFAWPRAASNPTPKQTSLLLDFHVGFLNKTPVLWTVLVAILVIGVAYYLSAGRRKDIAPVVAPAPDDPVPAGAGDLTGPRGAPVVPGWARQRGIAQPGRTVPASAW